MNRKQDSVVGNNSPNCGYYNSHLPNNLKLIVKMNKR